MVRYIFAAPFFIGVFMKIILLVVVTLIVSSCGRNTQNKDVEFLRMVDNDHYPVTIQNYNSNRERIEIVFDKKPTRVIANQQNTIETLLALDQEENIIAAACTSGHTTEFSKKYAARAKGLPNINKNNFDVETILTYAPDFIIGWQSTFNDRALKSTDFWNRRGVKTYIVENSNSILPVGTIFDECNFIKNMGKIFNEEEKANLLIKEITDELKTTLEQTRGRKKQKVLIIEYLGNYILFTDKIGLAAIWLPV